MHNAGEFIAWPENVAAFAIIFEAVDWIGRFPAK